MNFNLIGPAYADATLPVSAQDTINWIPEPVEAEGRSGMLFRTPQGLTSVATLAQQKCRGVWVMASVLYVVYGTSLYEIASDGTATDLGTVAGSGIVSMADNGEQLVIVNGTQGYVYNNSTEVFAQITDPDFPGANTVAFIDYYFVFDGANGQFFLSELSDGTSFDALDFATAETSPDPTVGVFVDHQELWVGGSDTIEIWWNRGGADFPFERSGVIQIGLGARHSIKAIDNTVYWLASNGMVYAAVGHNPQRISTFAIEQEIQKHTIADFFAWTYFDKGHWYYVLQCPNDGKTFVYDAASQMWHRRQSYGLTRWRAQFHAYCYDRHFVGDYTNGTVWELEDEVYTEGSDPLISERYTQYLHSEMNPIFHHELELVFDTGHGTSTGNDSDPMVEVRWSDDGGRNYSNFRQRSIGRIGEYGKRVRVHGLGSFRSRLFHLRVSHGVKRDLLDANVRATIGY